MIILILIIILFIVYYLVISKEEFILMDELCDHQAFDNSIINIHDKKKVLRDVTELMDYKKIESNENIYDYTNTDNKIRLNQFEFRNQ